MRSIEGVKDPRAALQLHALLTNAGFSEIQTNMVPLPLCAWGNGRLAFHPSCYRDVGWRKPCSQHHLGQVAEYIMLTMTPFV